MLRKSDNVFAALVSDHETSTIPADGKLVTNANLGSGGVCFVDAGGRRETYGDIATGGRYAIVQSLGVNKPLMRSPLITKGKETFSLGVHVDAVQQVTTVGYNGTTGSLPSANSTDYYLRIRRNDNNGRDNSQPTSQFAGPIKTDAAATQSEVAKELVKSGIKNFALDPDGYIKFEMLNAGARSAITATGTVTLTFTKGSKLVEASLPTATTAIVAGDYIAVSNVLTSPVYKVTSEETTSGDLTLEWAYQGETITIVASAVAIRITNANAVAAASGVQITGVENKFSVSNWRNYYTNRFTATFSDTAATITSLVGAKTGSGMWEQVAMDEFMNWGFEGQGTIGTPPTIRESAVKIPGEGANTALTSRYSVINIAWTEDVSYLTSNATAKGNVLIYLNLNGAATGLVSAAPAAGGVSTGKILCGALAPQVPATTSLDMT